MNQGVQIAQLDNALVVLLFALIVPIISLVIVIRLIFAILKLYNISRNIELLENKVKFIEMDVSKMDENIYELTILQKEQNEILQQILNKLES